LIAILLPALNKARRSASTTACASNVRQIHQGLSMYLIDTRGKVFWRGRNIDTEGMDWYIYGGREKLNIYGGNANPLNWFNSWLRPLNSYVGKKIDVFHCPADTNNSWSENTSCFEWVGTSYNFNANGAPSKGPTTKAWPFDGLAGYKVTNVKRPDKTVEFLDACIVQAPAVKFSWHDPKHFVGNVCFADGHVVLLADVAIGQDETADIKW
jgi:prepilin-type processing-associated H-X9-DG protein